MLQGLGGMMELVFGRGMMGIVFRIWTEMGL